MKAGINAIVDFIRREPALVLGLATAVLTLGAAFGLNLGDKQQAAVMSAVELIVSVIVRSQVTPTVKLPTPPA